MEVIQNKDACGAIERPRVAVLVGPTAVGKTAVALELAREIGAEIVNADSLQVYRELDIGTAKPTPAERALVPHHLVDVVDPPDPYDASRYSHEAREVIAELHRRGVPPLVVGGTGLYLKALLSGLFTEGSPNPRIRQRLRQELTDKGLPALHERLKRLDPASAWRLHPHDTYRILRALEVMEATGEPLSAWHESHQFRDAPYQTLKLGLIRPREELNHRIEERVEAMLAQGWLEEVHGLLSRYPPDLKPLQALGYRHLIAFLQGRWTWEEAMELLKRDTRRYAKRQLTWFRGDPEVRWHSPEQIPEMLAALRKFFRA
ncbi:MAG: tRNA (adenosine(37)-N6)-dimethylallyltransferase MiaA [Deltaproteobacteria bacterium]|nr:tRNA (adenosine(37)-N6)-dimethylallyltransferase MiaA [Deltaproteobacteria bacterium]MBI4794399.1 tRNA (adenosine(37)-N6)-dimethylallyltransferase MiaA [Deltaproteobacteria bacterium]